LATWPFTNRRLVHSSRSRDWVQVMDSQSRFEGLLAGTGCCTGRPPPWI
jgi:hypothetical protein